jgi:type I restriction enzyme S subunit
MKLVPLKDFCKMYQPPTISTKEMIPDGEFVVYGANGPIGRYNKFNHEESQLLITCRGATCGAVNMSEPFAWINGNAMVIQPDLKLATLEYMKYAFLGGIDVSSAITGSAQPQITRTTLEVIKVPLPSVEQQLEIVEKLDSAFTEIDLLETNLGKSDEKANQLLQSLLSSAFTSSVSTKEPSNSAANPGLAMKNMKIGEVVDLFNGSTPLKTNKDYWINGDIPWFTVEDLRKQGKFITYTEKFITKLGLKESSISLIPENAVLLCCTASVGAIAINKIRLTTNQQFNALVVKDTKKLLVEYLYYWFLSNMDLLKSLGRATTIDYVSMTKLRDMNFQLPSLEKQRDIVEKLDSSFAEIDLLKAQIKIKKDYATALRQSLLRSAFTQEEAIA